MAEVLISDILLHGKDNAMSGKDLCELLGIKPRELTERIEEERRSGHPIAATTDSKKPGYFIPANQQEFYEFIESLKRRAVQIFQTRQACIKTMKKMYPVLPEAGAAPGADDSPSKGDSPVGGAP